MVIDNFHIQNSETTGLHIQTPGKAACIYSIVCFSHHLCFHLLNHICPNNLSLYYYQFILTCLTSLTCFCCEEKVYQFIENYHANIDITAVLQECQSCGSMLSRCDYCLSTNSTVCQCPCYCDGDFDQCRNEFDRIDRPDFPHQACFCKSLRINHKSTTKVNKF